MDSLETEVNLDWSNALGKVLGWIQNRFVQFQPVLVSGGGHRKDMSQHHC